MASAFGVDHGDSVSKSLGSGAAKLGRKVGVLRPHGTSETTTHIQWGQGEGIGDTHMATYHTTTKKPGTWALKPKETRSTHGYVATHVKGRNESSGFKMADEKYGGGLTRRGKQAVGGTTAAGAVGGVAATKKDKVKKSDPFEVEKAFRMPGSFAPKNPLKAFGRKLQSSGSGLEQKGFVGAVNNPANPMKKKIGLGQMAAGSGMQRAGRALQRPTASAAVGGAAGGGLAVGGASAFQQRNKKKPGLRP